MSGSDQRGSSGAVSRYRKPPPAAAATPRTDTAVSPSTAIWPRRPFSRRLSLLIRLWIYKAAIASALSILRIVKWKKLRSLRPTYTKSYAVQDGTRLQNRVFVPRDLKAGENPVSAPMFLHIHGGGFCISDPTTDDPFCHRLAHEYGYVVVSLNYRKAPRFPFPVAVHDIEAMVLAVLSDHSIPGDRARVALGGFSAGGNLALTACQLDTIRSDDKITAVCALYPVVDFSGRFKGKPRVHPGGKKDVLKNIDTLFNSGYLPVGTDRLNPLLSPILAPRDRLPRKIFLLGVEYDVLCHPTEEMAKMLARHERGNDKGSYGDPADNQQLDSDSWDCGSIAWRLVKGAQHGFNQIPTRTKEEREQQKADTNYMYRELAQWLEKEVVRPQIKPSL